MLIDILKDEIKNIWIGKLIQKLWLSREAIQWILSSKKTSLKKLSHVYNIYKIDYDQVRYDNLCRKNKLYWHDVSDCIRTLRINKGLSIEELSYMSKVSIKTIQYIELWLKHKPQLYTINSLCNILTDNEEIREYIYSEICKLPWKKVKIL